MARPRIFVSHSSGAGKCAEHGCACVPHREAVVALLDELGCEAVVDQGVLRAGDLWHPKLLRELACCHGTVLLISPHALDSHYVFEEAMLSMYLSSVTDGHFLVLPVTLPGAGRDEIAGSSLGRLDLGRLDMVDWPANSPVPPAKLGDRLRSLVERHGALPYPLVTEYLAGRVQDVSAVTLSEIARELGVAHVAYAHDHAHYVVSAGLLSERPVAGVGAVCAMRKALHRLLPALRQDDRGEILDVVVPFARVPAAAAEELRALCATAAEGRVALLTADRTTTAQMYVRRASELPMPWPMCTPVPRPGMDFVDSVIAEIRAFLTDRFDLLDDEELLPWLALQEEESGPVTVVLGVQPDAELVRRLLAAFPKLLFLFAHGRTDAGGGPAEHTRLTALTAGQEREMQQTYRQFFTQWVKARP
ncbi:hypothetical protein [Streptomyces sp. NPDC046909]|uniref:hypothetical protein n=1 Tax=Streptomyces sp. NPDC046909 TaxID=3155617 RepID=UPI0033DFA927